MRMARFSAAVIVFLCTHTVFGFAMTDILRAGRHPEARHRRSLNSPANAIVEVVRSAMDSDENGEISIAEIEAYIDRWYNPNNIQPFTLQSYHIEGNGYMLTLANLIDLNGDGNIALPELRRAAEILVNNSGNAIVGKIIYMTIRYNQRLPSFSPQTEARKAVAGFMEAADLNKNGEISNDEAESIFGLRRFWWSRNNLRSNIDTADENGDGNLSGEEIVVMVARLAWRSARPLVCYVQIYEVAGKQLADEWASSW